MNQFNSIWNQNYIREVAARQHHEQQIQQGQDCIRKLIDLLDAMDKVEPAYQQAVQNEMCMVIFAHGVNRHM